MDGWWNVDVPGCSCVNAHMSIVTSNVCTDLDPFVIVTQMQFFLDKRDFVCDKPRTPQNSTEKQHRENPVVRNDEKSQATCRFDPRAVRPSQPPYKSAGEARHLGIAKQCATEKSELAESSGGAGRFLVPGYHAGQNNYSY